MKIALTKTENPVKHQYYIDWLKAGEEIEVITLSAENKNLDELNQCDALVLSGGIDIHPKYYGGTLDYPGAPPNFNERRDEFEISSFEISQKNNIPVLGICRGMQLINVIQQGTVIQDLTNDHKNNHTGQPDKYHPVHVEKESLLSRLTGVENGEVNSAHHQAIAMLGKGLLVNSVSEDGTVEGIEWQNKEKAFMLAIQWHPERMFERPGSPLSAGIRNQFISAIKNSIVRNADH
ncbi:MAG: gamma-glutamyl-gamma-aminobutyrate hydrolase family protein [Ginsengibacter sp.]